MNRLERDVRAFHRKFGHPARDVPGFPHNEAYRRFRRDLGTEEARELAEAMDEADLRKVAREAIDVIYVAIGTLVVYGIDVDRAWRTVHRANMEKERHPTDFRPVKPKGWRPPNLTWVTNPEVDENPFQGIVLGGLAIAVVLWLIFG